MGNYYDESTVRSWIIEYLALPAETRQTSAKGMLLKNRIFVEVDKIVSGEIFTHRFTNWGEFDDLKQDALGACIKALEKFDPTYVSEKTHELASSFNYFSLVVKRCLMYSTLRDKERRGNLNLMENLYIEKDDRYADNAQEGVNNIINKLNLIEFPKKYSTLLELLNIYLSHGSYNKREFLRFTRCFNQSTCVTRKFLKLLESKKDLFYEDISEDLCDKVPKFGYDEHI